MLKRSLVTLLVSVQQKGSPFFCPFILVWYKGSDTQSDILCLFSIFQANEVRKLVILQASFK